MNLFRIALGIGWAALVIITVRALQQLGLDGANVFIADLAHPWRLQFNADFTAHVLLMVTWIIYREPKLWVGLLCAALASFVGGAFSLAYIIAASYRAGGDARKLLLGRHA